MGCSDSIISLTLMASRQKQQKQTATEFLGSALTTGTSTAHPGTATEDSSKEQIAAARFVFTKQRQIQWAHATEELWRHGHGVIGLDGASGGFQGLVADGGVVYVVGLGCLQMIDYWHGKHDMRSRHDVSAAVPWCQMADDEQYPSFRLVSQKGRFAHALVFIQQEFRTKRFLRFLKALRLLTRASADVLYSIAHLCSGRELRNGIRNPSVEETAFRGIL